MPASSVEISDVVFKEYATVESEHNPYPYGMTSGSVYGEKTFEGATSLTVTLEYQTYTPSWDYITLYDNATSTTPINNKKYGGSTRTTETITVNGNYIKIVFTTASYSTSRGNYYGFKATITPNY